MIRLDRMDRSSRALRNIWSWGCILSFSILISNPKIVQAQPPSGNPAISVLNQLTTATGWTKTKIPADILAQGTLTQYSEGKSFTTDFVIKQKGANLSRLEIQGGDLVTLTNVDQASFVRRNGVQVLPFAAAISMRPYTFPFYSDLVNFTDPSVSATHSGVDSVGGQSAQRLDITRAPKTNDPQSNARRNVGHLSVWVSDTTHLPVQIKFPRVSPEDATALVDHLLVFSDYRTVGGVSIPYHQEEYVGTQKVAAIQLDKVLMNVGLSDANFVFLGFQK